MDYKLNALTIAPRDLFLWVNLKYKYRFVKKNISRVIRRSSDCVEQMKWSTTLQHTLEHLETKVEPGIFLEGLAS